MRKVLLAAAMVLAVGVGQAKADTIQPVLTALPSWNGIDYTWNYTANLSGGARVGGTTVGTFDQFFTLYDVFGLVGGSVFAPAGWAFSVQNVGITPSGQSVQAPGDSASVPNITFTYTAGVQVDGPFAFTGFGFRSITGITALGSFTSQDINNGAGTASNGTRNTATGNVDVPATVPEPASMLLLGAGLLGLAAATRRRR